ncbi:MAG: hypothetical protein QM755_17100 [Luteolibacter sp.]
MAVDSIHQASFRIMPTFSKGQFVEYDGLLAVVVRTPEDGNVPEDHLALWFGEPDTIRLSQGGEGGRTPQVWTVPAGHCLPVSHMDIRH